MAKKAKVVTADELAKQMKALHNQLFNAKAHLEIYKGVGQAWDKHIREIQNSPVFWQFTMKAHVDIAVLHLCRAYDSHKKALHLSSFLETIEQNPHLFSEAAFRERHKARPGVDGLARYARSLDLKQLSEDRCFCKRKNPPVGNLHQWRDNLVAHYNYEEAVLVQEPMHKRHPLPWADIEKLIDEGLSIVNRYSSLLDAHTYSNQFVSHQKEDHLYVLKSLRFARIGREWNRRRIHKNIKRKIAQGKVQ